MPRVSLKLSPERLKLAREATGWTQCEVMKKVRELEFKENSERPESDTATLARAYSRIERSGHTSKRRAELIAQVLGVMLEELQSEWTGPRGRGALLLEVQRALEARRHESTKGEEPGHDNEVDASWGWIDTALSAKSTREVALDVGRALEPYQLLAENREIDHLGRFLGVELKEQALHVDGLWMILCPELLSGQVGKIVHGVSGVCSTIETLLPRMVTADSAYLEDMLSSHGRYRLRFEYPLRNEELAIEIAPLRPGSSHRDLFLGGLLEMDAWLLHEELARLASRLAWQVKGFDFSFTNSDGLNRKARVLDTPPPEKLCFVLEHYQLGEDKCALEGWTYLTGEHPLRDMSHEAFLSQKEGGLGEKYKWNWQVNLLPLLRSRLEALGVGLVDWSLHELTSMEAVLLRQDDGIPKEALRLVLCDLRLVENEDNVVPLSWPEEAREHLEAKIKGLVSTPI